MDEENKNEVNEPEFPYGREIKIFNSFEVENAYTHHQYFLMTPQQRLMLVCEKLIAMFGKEVTEVSNPYKGLPVIIDE